MQQINSVITMTSKTKITLVNQNKYQFQHLLRHYQQAIQLTKGGEYLQPPDIFRVLDSMGYLCNQKTQKDYELISSLTYMLAHPKGQGIVSQRNLFQFLTIINSLHANVDTYFEKQVQPLPKDIGQLEQPLIQIEIGSFDKDGFWIVTKQQEKKIRQIFSNMIYTRVSRQDISTIKKKQSQIEVVQNFKPKILNRSAIIAQNRLKKMNMDAKVEDRLLQGRDQFNNRLYVEIKASLEKQLKECSFKPKINSTSKSNKKQIDSFSKEQILLQKGREYELKRKMCQQEYEQFRQNQQLSECSFHPDLSSSTSSLRHSLRRQFNPRVRNQQKSIERMRIARQERQSLNEVNKRGYPEGRSWVNFMEEVRTKRCNTSSYHNASISSEKPIIFTMDLKILGEQKHLQVKEADDILEMTQRICQNHNINTNNYQKVYNIIEKTLRQSGQALIKNGKVFLLKRN